jgi:hypothetical protein
VDQIELSAAPVFDLRVNGYAFKNMRVVEEWEGIKKLISLDGVSYALLYNAHPLPRCIDYAWDKHEDEWVVVNASHDIMDKLKQ